MNWCISKNLVVKEKMVLIFFILVSKNSNMWLKLFLFFSMVDLEVCCIKDSIKKIEDIFICIKGG